MKKGNKTIKLIRTVGSIFSSLIILTVAIGCFFFAGVLIYNKYFSSEDLAKNKTRYSQSAVIRSPAVMPFSEESKQKPPPSFIVIGGAIFLVMLGAAFLWIWFSKGIFGGIPPRAILHQMQLKKQE